MGKSQRLHWPTDPMTMEMLWLLKIQSDWQSENRTEILTLDSWKRSGNAYETKWILCSTTIHFRHFSAKQNINRCWKQLTYWTYLRKGILQLKKKKEVQVRILYVRWSSNFFQKTWSKEFQTQHSSFVLLYFMNFLVGQYREFLCCVPSHHIYATC